ncbi:MAG: hypothetical protein WBG92_00235 [Thiohalocapsa sp.]
MHTNTTSSRGADPAPAHLPTLCTVAQLAEIEPALGIGAIRDDLFHRRTNGLEASGGVIYRGRRILLDRARYLSWIAERSRRSAA